MFFSAAFVAVFATIAAAAPVMDEQQVRRAEKGHHSQVDLGTKYIDYGCDESIKETLKGALDLLCRDDAKSCDEGIEYSREVSWTDGSVPTDWPIKVSAEGEYPDKETLDNLKKIILASVTDETWYNNDIQWTRRDWQYSDYGTCPMTRFSNHIKATHWDDKDLQYKISLVVTMEAEDYSPCDLVGDMMKAAQTAYDAVGTVSGPLELLVCTLSGEAF